MFREWFLSFYSMTPNELTVILKGGRKPFDLDCCFSWLRFCILVPFPHWPFHLYILQDGELHGC